jgi:hypothetical protein
LRWISSEQLNVGLYPLQSERLVQNASIGHSVPEYFIASKEAKGAETILYSNTNKPVVVSVDDAG